MLSRPVQTSGRVRVGSISGRGLFGTTNTLSCLVSDRVELVRISMLNVLSQFFRLGWIFFGFRLDFFELS
jgi:hypothetical protein